MRYLLVLGFDCDVYRKEPRARIFVGDQLVDEFNILRNSSVNTYSVSNFTQLESWSRIAFLRKQINNFPSLRFYEVEIDKNMDQLILRINVENQDSNYTNGFVSKSTLIKLKVCMFFPLDQKILTRLSKIVKKKFFKKNFAWLYAQKNDIFNPLHAGCLRWIGDNKEIYPDNFTNFLYTHNIGGNGYFICNLLKKYGIFFHKIKKSYRLHFFSDIINYLIDKYQKHANSRNTN
jgi:hypothetical protein